MIFLSFGAGVQSSTMLMMAISGELPRPDHVIFADTGIEPASVYKHLEWCREQCSLAGLPLHVISAKSGNMVEQLADFESGAANHWNNRPPLWIDGAQFGRQCTKHAKLHPITRLQLALMGHKTARTAADSEAIVWIGISTDETRRASPSRDRWIDRQFPLIDPLRMSRADCQAWWQRNYPSVALPSSSCTICPYHSDSYWRDMPAADFSEACDYDDRIRRAYIARTDQTVYLHRSCRPLRSIDFNHGQADLFSDDDTAMICSGGCGL